MNDVFKKVHLSEKKKIFKKIVDDRTVLLVKTELMDVQQVVSIKIIDDKIIECDFLKEKEFDLKNSEMGIISINAKEDKYFFYGLVAQNEKKIYIDIQGDFYYLQRRRSARLDLPDNYNSKCKIVDFRGKMLPFDCDVIDISSGGCRLSLPSLEPIIRGGTILKLKITLGHRSPFEVRGEVRHAKPIRDYSDLPQVMGIQFTDYDAVFEAKMLNLYMDVQREIFLKYIKK
jgi:hypothetical protein